MLIPPRLAVIYRLQQAFPASNSACPFGGLMMNITERIALSNERYDQRERDAAEYESRLIASDLLKPGALATMSVGSDAYPYEVVDHTVFTSGKKKGKVKTVTVCMLKSHRTDSNGMSESQEYEYTSNPDNETQVLKAFYDTDGSLRGIGDSTYRSGNCVRISGSTRFGHARKYRDPSF